MATATEPIPAVVQHVSLLDQIAEEQARKQADVASRYMPTLSPKQFTEREKLMRDLREMLVAGTDYGVIPGTEKPTLLLPGAQKVCAYFGYVPKYTNDAVTEDWQGSQNGEPLFYYRLTCTLEKDRQAVGGGLGSCNSWETKYRWRNASRKCPQCGGEFIIASKEEYGGGWLCFKKKGGCGAKFPVADQRIASQQVGRVANADFADIINTVLKMAKKRAYIDATLSATGLSQYFTQDMKDQPREEIDTGGHPAGTQAAADHVAQTKIEQAKSDVPKPVEELWARMGTSRAKIIEVLQELYRDLVELAGQDEGDAEYLRISKQFAGGDVQKMTPLKMDLAKRTVLELWKASQQLRPESKDDWLPDGVFDSKREEVPHAS